jgi:hypothetical protein
VCLPPAHAGGKHTTWPQFLPLLHYPQEISASAKLPLPFVHVI